ncbi:MAG: SH3 domain-containing protein, partial [Saprospiraceae bacterium]
MITSMIGRIVPLLMLCILCTLPSSIQASVVLPVEIASPIYIATTSFDLYETRSSSSKVVVEVPKGAEVKVINSSYGSWWQVEYKKRTGFVQSSNLKYSSINDQMEYDPIVNSSNLYNSKPTFNLKTEVNLFEHDASSSAILLKMPEGSNVKVVDSSNSQWWLVHYKGRTGYARSSDMNYNNDELVSRSVADNMRKVTKATSFRDGPDSKARVLLRFEPGDQVIVLDDSGHWWWKVSFQGREGWVKRQLLEK